MIQFHSLSLFHITVAKQIYISAIQCPSELVDNLENKNLVSQLYSTGKNQGICINFLYDFAEIYSTLTYSQVYDPIYMDKICTLEAMFTN